MAMQRIEDMDCVELDTLVSLLLEEDQKNPAKYKMPELGDADGLWKMLNGNKSSGKSGFALGELNIICVGGRTR